MELNSKDMARISEEARETVESFSKKISEHNLENIDEGIVREEGIFFGKSSQEDSEEFREIIFENAPKKNKDFILAEKKKWKN